jgi:transcriptional regulator with XRE-family HTH domain
VSKLPLPDLGAYLREQRENAQLSLRQLADLAGVSNPYLSQIERGLKRPSAEILQQIAKGLKVSAESLYVRAGILDERVQHDDPAAARNVLAAIAADPVLTDRQRGVLVEIYLSFVGEHAPSSGQPAPATTPSTPTPSTAPRSGPSRRRRHASTGTPAATTAGVATDVTRDVTTDVTREVTRDVNEKEN